MTSILDKILARKREEVAALRVAQAQGQAPAAPAIGDELPRRSLSAALRRPAGAPVRVLAEIKRASPSAGAIAMAADPPAVARAYERAGAAAISVLTDRDFFAGDLAFMTASKRAVAIPILRKDFLIDPLQIAEARAHGADAVLLIVAALPGAQLAAMLAAARGAELDALVEAHTLAEADAALAAGATVLGVNHRDLHTFAIDMSLTAQIAARVPTGTILVAESGIKTPDDVRRMSDAGAHAVLVGEQLMRAADPGAALRALTS